MRVTIEVVEVSDAVVTAIPRGNILVPRDEFAAVWREAERVHEGERTWRTAGFVMTCRWLAGATVRPPDGRPYLAQSPVTGRTAVAYEELIEAEVVEADKLAIRSPDWLDSRPGWLDAVIATLKWAWTRHGGPLVGSEPDGRGGFYLKYAIEFGPPRVSSR